LNLEDEKGLRLYLANLEPYLGEPSQIKNGKPLWTGKAWKQAALAYEKTGKS